MSTAEPWLALTTTLTVPVLSRTGQVKGAGDTLALFKQKAIPEILGAFERKCVLKGKVKERTIRGAKEAAFPVTGRMVGRYHDPGTAITGSTNSPSDLNEVIIKLDGLLIADYSQYKLDDLMNYYDLRSSVTTELGRALATEWDKRAFRMVVAAAKRTVSPLGKAINADRIGYTKTLTAAFNNAATTKQAKGDELISAIGDAIVAMRAKDVETEGMCIYVRPEEYDLLAESSRAINADYNGAGGANGTIADGRVGRIKGVPVMWSNHVSQPAYVLQALDRNPDYEQDLTKCRALIFNADAIGVLTLQGIGLDMTAPSGDYATMYQSDLMVAKMCIGMGVMRGESAAAIFAP